MISKAVHREAFYVLVWFHLVEAWLKSTSKFSFHVLTFLEKPTLLPPRIIIYNKFYGRHQSLLIQCDKYNVYHLIHFNSGFRQGGYGHRPLHGFLLPGNGFLMASGEGTCKSMKDMSNWFSARRFLPPPVMHLIYRNVWLCIFWHSKQIRMTQWHETNGFSTHFNVFLLLSTNVIICIFV